MMQLLTKKGSNIFVVNTQSKIQPSSLPQARIPPNIGNKVLKVNPSGFVTSTLHESKRPHNESTLEKALKNDGSFVVSSSTPLTLNPTLIRTQTGPFAISARLECRLSFLSFR